MSVCVVVAVFVVSLCSCCCHTHPLHIAHWLKIFAFASHSIPWSSPCRIHELSVLSDFLDLFINFTFLLFFIFLFQHFLLPFIFPEVESSITLRCRRGDGSNDKNVSSTSSRSRSPGNIRTEQTKCPMEQTGTTRDLMRVTPVQLHQMFWPQSLR